MVYVYILGIFASAFAFLVLAGTSAVKLSGPKFVSSLFFLFLTIYLIISGIVWLLVS